MSLDRLKPRSSIANLSRSALALVFVSACGARTGLNDELPVQSPDSGVIVAADKPTADTPTDTGTDAGTSDSSRPCEIAEVTYGDERTSVVTPEGLRVVGAGGVLHVYATDPACLPEIARAVQQGSMELRSPRGDFVEPSTNFTEPHIAEDTTGRYVHTLVKAENLAAAYNLAEGVPNRTNINDQLSWTFRTALGTRSGTSFFHVQSAAWNCTTTPNISGDISRASLQDIRFNYSFAADSISNITVCFGLTNEKNYPADRQLRAELAELQRPSGSCLLDQPGACMPGQTCNEENQCIDARWCRYLTPGESTEFSLPADVREMLVDLDVPFSLQPSYAISSPNNYHRVNCTEGNPIFTITD